MIALLLQSGANSNTATLDAPKHFSRLVNGMDFVPGTTPLILATFFSSVESVEMLLKAKTKVAHRDKQGRTALWHAKLRINQQSKTSFPRLVRPHSPPDGSGTALSFLFPAKTYTLQIKPLGSLPESVCARPKMYTTNGTLEEAGAFLYGFYSGMASHNRSDGAQREVMAWAEFGRWACEQLGAKRGNWCALCQHLRLTLIDDDAGFEKLATLLTHYRREQTNPS